MAIDISEAPTPVIPEAVPIEPRTPMKPSEALRLGSMTTKQAFGTRGDYETACAVGAMMIGYGLAPWDIVLYDDGHPSNIISRIILPMQSDKVVAAIERAYRPLWPTACPVRGCCLATISRTPVVVHLNDNHRWDRMRIADWLEGIGL